jgi:3-oxoadipate enol-lactonase
MATFIEGSIAANGTTLYARIDGEEGRPAIVLLNSLATDIAMWAPQIDAFAARYRVLRFDARGHGRSSAPNPPYSLDMLVDDLFAVMAHHRVHRPHVVGISLGGVVAAAAALRDPASLASIAICDSRVEVPPEFLGAIDDRNRLVRDQGIEAVVEPFVERWFTPATLADAPATIADVRRMIRATTPAGFIGCAEALKAARILDRLGAIGVPSLFLVGDHDAAVPTAVMRDQQRRVPGARYAEIPAAGHLSNLERPAAFNAAILDFIQSVDHSQDRQ